MKRHILSSFAALLFVVAVTEAFELPEPPFCVSSQDGFSAYRAGELLVRFVEVEPGGQPPEGPAILGPRLPRSIRQSMAQHVVDGSSVKTEYGGLVPGLAMVRLPAGTTVADALAKFNSSPNVLYAEPNYKYKLLIDPNDMLYPGQWGLNNLGQSGGMPDADIDAAEAWDLQTGDPNIIVAVLDTGIDYNHPDLRGNMWVNEAEADPNNSQPGVDDDGNGYIDDIYGYDFAGFSGMDANDGDGDPCDFYFHGTHVAGTIGAVANNGEGIAGVAWNVRLMALKIFPDDEMVEPETFGSEVLAAVEYAIANDANVINASWGGPDFSIGLLEAVTRANEEGIMWVSAAGNDASDNDQVPVFPASFGLDNMISVMSTDANDMMSTFSNFGEFSVDVAEPGTDIWSTMPTYMTPAMEFMELATDYETLSGTSFAAPHVSGACALLMSQYPQFPASLIKTILLKTVDPVLSSPRLCASGGRVNVFNAISVLPNVKEGTVLNTRTDVVYDSIQAAIDEAEDGDTLIADANSMFLENVDFSGKQVVLRSGDIANPSDPNVSPHNTYILGFLDEGSVVSFVNGEGQDTVIDGFTISWGENDYGGGIRCDGSSPTISSCVVRDNFAEFYGGGIDCYGGSPRITNCVVSYNQTSAAAGVGGGINCEDGAPTIEYCTVSYNYADNVGGGIACFESSANIVSCVIANNSARYGSGGIDLETSSPSIINCTILVDTASVPRADGIYASDDSDPTIMNCILWGNGDDLVNCEATYSSIEDGDPGVGNVSLMPTFVAGPLGRYYLSQTAAGQLADSTCIDLGNPSTNPMWGIGQATTRTDGELDAAPVDIGAHYIALPAEMIDLVVTVVDPNGDPIDDVNDPNALHGYVDPNSGTYREYEVVELTAYPDEGYRVKAWTGTNDDNPMDPNNTTVTLIGSGNVTVEFEEIPLYRLRTTVIGAGGTLDPTIRRGEYYPDGTVITLSASPDKNYIVDTWTGTDDDSIWSNTNFVTVDADKDVTVTFRQPKTMNVPGQFGDIQDALDTAYDHGDKVIVSPGTYEPFGSYMFQGKEVVVASEHPDDPCCVAATVIDCGSNGRAFTLMHGEGPDAVIEGFTIINGTGSVEMLEDFFTGEMMPYPVEPNSAPNTDGTGMSGVDATGGAIACLNGSSPTISNLIIKNCTAQGQNGENGSGTHDAPDDPDDALDPLDPNDPNDPYPDIDPNDPNTYDPNGLPGYDPNDPNSFDPSSLDPNDPIDGMDGADGLPGLDGLPGANGLDGLPGWPGGHGGAGLGGALYFGLDCKPTILNVRIENCRAIGGNAGYGGVGQNGQDGQDGQEGQEGQEGQDGQAGYNGGEDGAAGNGGDGGAGGPGGAGGRGGDGGWGGNGGDAIGAAIYFDPNCVATIRNLEIVNCVTIPGMGNFGGAAGSGGDGGDGAAPGAGGAGADGGADGADGAEGPGGNGGDGGWGGNMGENSYRSWAGAIYFGPECTVDMSDTKVSYCDNIVTLPGNAWIGGDAGNGGDGGDGDGQAPGGNGGWGGMGGWGGPGRDDGGSRGAGGSGGNNNAENGERGVDGSGYMMSGTYGLAFGNYYDYGCVVHLKNCKVSYNTGTDEDSGSGSGEYYAGSSTVTLDDCEFIGNYGYSGAGQNFGYACSIDINDCNYVGNRTYSTFDKYYTFSSIYTSSTYAHGGGLYIGPDSQLDMKNSKFIRNACGYGNGGGLYYARPMMAPCTFSISKSMFVKNRAVSGGGICWDSYNCKAMVEDSLFSGNVADHGGGLFWSGDAPEIRGCVITGNEAKGSLAPFALHFVDPSILMILGEGNNDSDLYGGGGGIFALSTDAKIENCFISNNSTSGSGGGVYLAGDPNVPVLRNCLIKGNSAVIDGGGIVSYWYVTPEISNCTIVDNSVFDPRDENRGRGGGLSCSYESETTLTDSILWGNTATHGSQISIGSISDPRFLDRPATLSVAYCDIEGGDSDDSVHVESGRTLNWGDGNIDDDPLFVGSAYHLSHSDIAGQSADSPCINAGSGTVTDLLLAEHTTRSDGVNDTGVADMGLHYPTSEGRFTLTVNVVGGQGTVSPLGGEYDKWTTVVLVADVDPGYRVRWVGADNDASTELTNTVTMYGDRTVTAYIEQPTVIKVPGDYPLIQEAIDASNDGDTIVINKGTYRGGPIVIPGKAITLTGTNPNDPCSVAETIIDGFGYDTWGLLISGACGPDTVISGLTISNYRFFAAGQLPPTDPGLDGDHGVDYWCGGIYVDSGASPTIVNCRVTDCVIRAGDGSNGTDGINSGDPIDSDDPNAGVFGYGGGGGRGGDGGTAYGAGIYCAAHTSPTIIGCTISDCIVIGADGDFGGAGGTATAGLLAGDGGDGGHAGGAYGGGIYLGYSSTATIKDCNIVNCQAVAGLAGNAGAGGAASGQMAEAGEGGLGGRSGPAYGGGIYFGDKVLATVMNCTISGCETTGGNAGDGGAEGVGSGGAVDGPAGNGGAYIGDYELDSAYGGGVYCGKDAQITFVDCNIADCNSAGGMSGIGGDVAVGVRPEPVFSYMIPAYGVGVFCDKDSVVSFTGCELNGNRSVDIPFVPDANDPNNPRQPGYRISPYVSYGGAIGYMDAERVTVEDCNFVGNFATVGGAMYWSDSNSVIADSNFLSNEAFKGGGLYCIDSEEVEILRCLIEDNNSVAPGGEGGGIHVGSTPISIVDCQILNNLSAVSGGGIYASGSGGGEGAKLMNSLIAGNSALNDGGGITSAWHNEMVISNCTIADNTLLGAEAFGGGLAASYGSNVEVADTIIWGNTAMSDGTQIGVTSSDGYPRPSKVTVTYSDVEPDPVIDVNGAPAALDIAFVIDSTISMTEEIDAVKAAALNIVSRINAEVPDFRIGVVDYRDFDVNDPNVGGVIGDYPYRTDSPFTRDPAQIAAALNGIMAGGGGNWPETVYTGLVHSIDSRALEARLIASGAAAYIDANSPGLGPWRSGEGVARAIILIGDAPPQDPETFTSYVLSEVVDAANESPAPRQIISIVAAPDPNNPDPRPYFRALSEGTGGVMIEAADAAAVVDAILRAVDLLVSVPSAIYVEEGCEMPAWDPNTHDWDASANNIEEDPNFVESSYYLSHLATGHLVNSPAINAGSNMAVLSGMFRYTTRIDGVRDSIRTDIGYHYSEGVGEYTVHASVIEDANDPGIHGTVVPAGALDPDGVTFLSGTDVRLTAIPEEGYTVRGWYDANDIFLSYNETYEFTIDANTVLNVRFRKPRKVEVSGGGAALQEAVNEAGNGDTLVLAAETFTGNIDFLGKELRIVSANPDDPNIVQDTVVSGGFIFSNQEDSDAVINGITITGANHALFVDANSSPTFRNLTISGCFAADGLGGAAVFIDSNSNPTFENITITNCSVSLAGGGAIYLSEDSIATFVDCLIANCTATGGGGAVYADVNSVPDFEDCEFLNSQSGGSSGGALFFAEESRPLLTRCQIENNTAALNGGGAFYDVNSVAEIIDCNFVNNTAAQQGGGIACYENVAMIIADSNITDCDAAFGAGLYVDANCAGTMVRGEVLRNLADQEGGGFYVEDSNAFAVADCNVAGNRATRGGGFYYLNSPLASIERCSINNNGANPYVEFVVWFWNDPNFPFDQIPATVHDPNFSATDPNYTSDPNYQPQTFANTSGQAYGAGIYSFAGPTLIADSDISNNSANTSGGGIYFAAGEYDPITLRNCVITENSASRDGAGVSSNWQNDLTVSNCTIADNTLTNFVSYGGGLYSSYDSTTVVTDSIIYGNQGARGAQIGLGSGDLPYPMPSQLKITHSNIDLRTAIDVNYADADRTPALRSGFDSYALPAGHNVSSGPVDLGFIVNYLDNGNLFGPYSDTIYVNNSGSVTFNGPLSTFDPNGLRSNIGTSIIAPFFADADTRDGMVVTYGSGSVDGNDAFGVNWTDVGHFSRGDKVNTFQLILISRPDRDTGAGFLGSGDFDIEFNYGSINWETGDGNGGQDGLGGDSARIGFSHGNGAPGSYWEMPGSGVPGSFLDSNPSGLVHGSRNSDTAGRYIYSVIDGAVDVGRNGAAVWAQEGCLVEGYAPYDPNFVLDEEDPVSPWDPGTHNINTDPNFVSGSLGDYYLEQIGAGHLQILDSNCVDMGSASAGSLGMDQYTTRTDLKPDANTVDIGAHYPTGGWAMDRSRSKLTVVVIGNGSVTVSPCWDIDPNGTTYDPNDPNAEVHSFEYYANAVVCLTAAPDEGYRVRNWTGADEVPYWNKNVNYATLDVDKTIIVEFEEDVTHTILVPQDYPNIQAAVNAAGPGGVKIVVSRGVHSSGPSAGINFQGKSIVLMSLDPNDPNIVANTIIDCQGGVYNPRRAFHFQSGEDPNAMVLGFTIRNGYMTGGKGIAGRFGMLTPEPYEPIGNNANDPPRAERAQDAFGDGYGGAILCENGSSPTIQNCVIEDCVVTGAHGGDGAEGQSTGAGYPPQWSYLAPGDTQVQNTNNGQWGGHAGSGDGTGYGGAIACLDYSSPIIVGCTLRDNVARGGCGGFGGNGGNSAAGNESHGGSGGMAYGDGIGGGLYAEDGSAPVVVDCNFVGNMALTGIEGLGGIRGTGSALTPPAADGSTGFAFSNGGIAGGAAYYTGADANFVNCVFVDNMAAEPFQNLDTVGSDVDIARFAAPEGLVLLDRIEFVDSQTRGGALYLEAFSTLLMQGSELMDNMAGAVYVGSGCSVDVNNCLFENNQSLADDGGALRIGQDSNSVSLANINFYGNVTVGGGGAVRCMSSATFENCWFGGNEAGTDGGGLDVWNVPVGGGQNDYRKLDLTFDECGFIGNQAIAGFYGRGGGLRMQDVNAVLTSCYFLENDSKSGGGLYIADGTAVLTDGVVQGNAAIGASGGANPTLQQTSRLGVSYAPEQNLGTDAGGGVLFSNTDVRIENYLVVDNTVEGYRAIGGGLSFFGGNLTNLVRNCLITGNSSSKYGGAIGASAFAKPEIVNCTFAGDGAGELGGAVYADWSADAAIVDSIFEDCNSTAIVQEDKGGAVVEHCLFHNNPDGDYGVYDSVEQVTAIYSGAELDGNIEADPLFVAGPLGDYYLSQVAAGQSSDSPAINAGSRTSIAAGLLAYTTRTDGGRDLVLVDIGYHYLDHTKLAQYELTASVVGGHGSVQPTNGMYYDGMVVQLTTYPEIGHRVEKWTGTVDDYSRDANNLVIMSRDRNVTVEFDQPNVLVVGSDPNYTTIWHALDAAVDGDVIVLPTDTYTPMGPRSELWITKAVTITSSNPDDPCCVAATVLNNYTFDITTVDGEALIDGITILGGRMDISSCSPTIRNCVFTECRLFGADGGNPTNFPDDGMNGYSMQGGAMHITNGSPIVQNCTFDGCSVAGGDGGDGDGGVANTHPEGFDGGWAGWAYGGAVYCGYGGSPAFVDCSFMNCYAQGGNGGNGGNGVQGAFGGRAGNWEWEESIETGAGSPGWIWWDGWDYGGYEADGTSRGSGNILPTGSLPWGYLFKDYWKYSGYGGAVYCENEASPRFHNCTFENNATFGGMTGIGGSPYGSYTMFAAGGAVQQSWNGPMRNINIENLGGAFYGCYGSDPEFYNCVFTDNFADTYVDPNLANTPDDIIVSYGGSLAFEDDCNVKFVDCTITDSNACIGGGVFWGNAEATFIDCNVTENVAYDGGGLYLIEAVGNITTSKIGRNAARMDVWADHNDVNNYDPNYFAEGGGLFALSSVLDINDSIFSRNRAGASGGALYLTGISNSLGSSTLLHNCLLTGNITGRDGGAISANWYSEPVISNCTIADNIVSGHLGDLAGYGGGVYTTYDCNATIINSILWGNAGARGSQIAVGIGSVFEQRESALHVSFSDVQGWIDANYPGTVDGNAVWVDANNVLNWDFNSMIDADPNFLKGFYLSQIGAGQDVDSPCVDAGSANSSDPDIALANYTTRTDGEPDIDRVDMGYHYRGAAPPRSYYAVVVGVADYVGVINDLRYTDDDANDFAQALVDSLNWSSTNITLLLDEDATKDNIRSAIADMGMRMTPDDVFVFFFAGHGTIGPDIEPIDEADNLDEYLATYAFENVRDDELGEWLAELPTENYIIFLDACHSGGHIGSTTSADDTILSLGLGNAAPAVGDSFAQDLIQPRRDYVGILDLDDNETGTVIAACAEGTLALESGELEHTVFAYYLLEGLRVQADLDSGNPDGWVSVEELYYYMEPRIREWTLQRELYGFQETQIYDAHVGDIPFYDYNENDKVEFTADVIGGNGSVEPGSGQHIRYEVIDLNAMPDEGYRVKEWIGTDDDDLTTRWNQIVLDDDRNVTVEFDQAVVLHVPGEYPYASLGHAIDAARDGDTIVIAPGAYVGSGYVIRNKEITITSTNPDDANVVANTVIDYTGQGARGFWFAEGSGSSVLNGITLTGIAVTGADGNADDLSGVSLYGHSVVVGYGTSPIISNCVIEDCLVLGGNGATATVNDPNNLDYIFGMAGNGGNASGAGIYAAPNSHPTIRNCVVRNCVVVGGSGADAGDTGFGWGAEGGRGGWAKGAGIYIGADSRAVLEHVTVENCGVVAGNGGSGGSSLLGGNGGWSGLAQGAGVYCGPNSKPTFIDCTITDCNIVGGNGGNGGDGSSALFVWTSTGRAGGDGGSWSDDEEWQAYGALGGGVFCDTNSTPQLIGCSINNNRVTSGTTGIGGLDGATNDRFPVANFDIPACGAGLFVDANSTLAITDCNVSGNLTAFVNLLYTGYGGGIYVRNVSSAAISDCNVADNGSTIGGGLYSLYSNVVVQDSNFVGNGAYIGGGMMLMKSEAEIAKSLLSGNIASLEADPNVLIDPNDPNTIPVGLNGYEGVQFASGAGICSFQSDALFTDTTFTRNLATGSGGGLYASQDSNTLEVLNCLFTYNGGARDGGGISVAWNASVAVTNCTFVGNASAGGSGEEGIAGVGGGIYCAYGASCDVINSILWQDYALRGPELAVGTGFEYDARPGVLTVSYSNVMGGRGGVEVEEGCTVIWGDGNINTDPLFATGILGDYYLNPTSQCVDGGADYASRFGLIGYTTRTDDIPDTGIADIGYHYWAIEPCRFCDLAYDAIIDFQDFAVIAASWLDTGCSDAGGWCDGADVTFDASVDMLDVGFLADCWLVQDREPPQPDPAQWLTEPYTSSGTSVSMEAETAFDAWGWEVQYYFECVTENGHDSGWQDSPRYTDHGLPSGVRYGYRVKARDTSPYYNETDWSETIYTGTEDLTPPAPAPGWRIAPYAVDSNSISMEATTSSDENGVEYYFECVSGDGGTDSGWQTEPNYTDVGEPNEPLDANTVYCYRVKARDLSNNRNETVWSEVRCAATLIPADILPPIPSPMIWDPNLDPNGYTGEPLQIQFDPNDPSYGWGAIMRCVTAYDPPAGGLVEYFFECTNDHRFDSGWIQVPTYTVQLGGDWYIGWFRVRARDAFGNMTEWSVTLPAVYRDPP